MNATTIGLDIAKSSFQLHGVDAAGEVVLRRKLPRGKVLPFGCDNEYWPTCADEFWPTSGGLTC